MLLNDVQGDKRLAYLLGLTIQRHKRGGMARRAARMTALGATAILLFFLWKLLQWR